MRTDLRDVAAAITSAVLSQHKLELNEDAARMAAQFYGHVLYFLNHFDPVEDAPAPPPHYGPRR